MLNIPPVQKPVAFEASSLADLRAFPSTARHQAGYQLDRVQRGLEPDDWKAIPRVGRGCREIRIRDEDGAYRVMYVANTPDAIHVLHAFQKKTQKTRNVDIDLATKRYKDLLDREHRQ